MNPRFALSQGFLAVLRHICFHQPFMAWLRRRNSPRWRGRRPWTSALQGTKRSPRPPVSTLASHFPSARWTFGAISWSFPRFGCGWGGWGSWGRGWRWKGGACERTNIFIGFLVKHIRREWSRPNVSLETHFLSPFRCNLQLCMMWHRSWCTPVEDKPPFFTAHPGGKQFGDYDERHLCPGMSSGNLFWNALQVSTSTQLHIIARTSMKHHETVWNCLYILVIKSPLNYIRTHLSPLYHFCLAFWYVSSHLYPSNRPAEASSWPRLRCFPGPAVVEKRRHSTVELSNHSCFWGWLM